MTALATRLLSISLLAAVLAIPGAVLVSASNGPRVFTGSTGFLIVHRVGDGVYYVTMNQSTFKRVGNALVLEFNSEEEWLRFRCRTLPWIPVLRDLGLNISKCAQAGLESLAYGEGNVTAGQPVEDPIGGLMREAGVPYYRALVARVVGTNTTLLVIRVPGGYGPEASSVAAKAKSVLEEKLGVNVDAVVVVETLWPPRPDAEAHARSLAARLGPALEAAWSAWRSHAGRVPAGAAVVAYSSGDPIFYLAIKVSKSRMEALKTSLGDVVGWLENVTGAREPMVVVVFDEEGGISPLPLKPSHGLSLLVVGAVVVSFAIILGIAALARGGFNLRSASRGGGGATRSQHLGRPRG